MTDRKDSWKFWEGKKVRIKLRDKIIYSGFVNYASSKYISLTDKYFKPIFINTEVIERIEEWEDKNNE